MHHLDKIAERRSSILAEGHVIHAPLTIFLGLHVINNEIMSSVCWLFVCYWFVRGGFRLIYLVVYRFYTSLQTHCSHFINITKFYGTCVNDVI